MQVQLSLKLIAAGELARWLGFRFTPASTLHKGGGEFSINLLDNSPVATWAQPAG